MKAATTLRRRAIRIKQNSTHPLYLFTVTASELLELADISRVSRDSAGHLIGYQRPEARPHIKSIVKYLDGDGRDLLFPNAIILSLSSTCRFKRSRGPHVKGPGDAGILSIPLPEAGRERPAWIVDGQQRAIALSQCRRKDFPIPVTAFVADDVAVQRSQFLLVNTTKPLPNGLINELLPEVTTALPAHLAVRKAAAKLCEVLSQDPESPFKDIIRRASMDKAARKRAVVQDTVMVRMIRDSLTSPSGCLFPFRDVAKGVTDYDGVRKVLLIYWNAVRDVFKDAWGLPHQKSRLMHSAGILAMGRLMDKVMATVDVNDARAPQRVKSHLQRIKPICAWTSGTWDEMGGKAWNEVQNLHRDLGDLTSILVRAYLRRSAA